MIKLIIKVVIFVLILGVLINDLGVIFLAHYQIKGVAEEALQKAIETRVLTNDYRASIDAAQEVAEQNNAEVAEFDIKPRRVKIKLIKVPNTLVLHHIALLKEFIVATAEVEAPSS